MRDLRKTAVEMVDAMLLEVSALRLAFEVGRGMMADCADEDVPSVSGSVFGELSEVCDSASRVFSVATDVFGRLSGGVLGRSKPDGAADGPDVRTAEDGEDALGDVRDA